MKIVRFGILVFFLLHQEDSDAAVVRKQPAYSKPIYSNAYLPAAMQVIFHAVGQLKNLQAEESDLPSTSVTTTTTKIPETSPHAPGQHQPVIQHSEVAITDSPSTSVASTESKEFSEAPVTPSIEVLPALTKVAETSTSSPLAIPDQVSTLASGEISSTTSDDSVTINREDQVNGAETPEENYATPETNHEVQEPVQEVQEPVQEVQEPVQEAQQPVQEVQELNEETEEKVDHDPTFELSTTLSSKQKDDSDEDSSEESDEKKENKDSSEETDEEKNSSEESRKMKSDSNNSSEESKDDTLDSSEEEEDEEIRFTLIGEKVSQVPRPSLSNYLRKTVKAPLRSSVTELAGLYDSLSKDARRQGLAKFSGYSDEFLKILETSADGGIGPQLRILLEKVVERKELTRDDARMKVSVTLKHLSDSDTELSRDLRRIIPLRFIS